MGGPVTFRPLMMEYVTVVGAHYKGRCSSHGSQRAKRKSKEPGTKYVLQGHALSNLLPPTRPYLPKFLPPPNSTSLGTKLSTHESFGGISDLKYNNDF